MSVRPENWNGAEVEFIAYWPGWSGPNGLSYKVTAWWSIHPPVERLSELRLSLDAAIGPWAGNVLPETMKAPGIFAAAIGAAIEGCVGIDVYLPSLGLHGRWRR